MYYLLHIDIANVNVCGIRIIEMNANDASIDALSIAGGITLLARYHAYPERFSRKVRRSTIRWLGVALIVGGFLLAFWDLLGKALSQLLVLLAFGG
jgi:hypothetical protein